MSSYKMTLRQQLNSEKTMKNEMRSEMIYLVWLIYLVFLFVLSAFGSCFRTLAVILVSDFVFSVFLLRSCFFFGSRKLTKEKVNTFIF